MSNYSCTISIEPGTAPDDAKAHHVKDKGGRLVRFKNPFPSYGHWKDISLLHAGFIYFRYVSASSQLAHAKRKANADILRLPATNTKADFLFPTRPGHIFPPCVRASSHRVPAALPSVQRGLATQATLSSFHPAFVPCLTQCLRSATIP